MVTVHKIIDSKRLRDVIKTHHATKAETKMQRAMQYICVPQYYTIQYFTNTIPVWQHYSRTLKTINCSQQKWKSVVFPVYIQFNVAHHEPDSLVTQYIKCEYTGCNERGFNKRRLGFVKTILMNIMRLLQLTNCKHLHRLKYNGHFRRYFRR